MSDGGKGEREVPFPCPPLLPPSLHFGGNHCAKNEDAGEEGERDIKSVTKQKRRLLLPIKPRRKQIYCKSNAQREPHWFVSEARFSHAHTPFLTSNTPPPTPPAENAIPPLR